MAAGIAACVGHIAAGGAKVGIAGAHPNVTEVRQPQVKEGGHSAPETPDPGTIFFLVQEVHHKAVALRMSSNDMSYYSYTVLGAFCEKATSKLHEGARDMRLREVTLVAAQRCDAIGCRLDT